MNATQTELPLRARKPREPDWKREARESEIYSDLIDAPDPYRRESNKLTIQVGHELYSPHWLLCYLQIRHAGVACRYTSRNYTYERCQKYSFEWHEEPGPGLDIALLWAASELLRQRKLKQSVALKA